MGNENSVLWRWFYAPSASRNDFLSPFLSQRLRTNSHCYLERVSQFLSCPENTAAAGCWHYRQMEKSLEIAGGATGLGLADHHSQGPLSLCSPSLSQGRWAKPYSSGRSEIGGGICLRSPSSSAASWGLFLKTKGQCVISAEAKANQVDKNVETGKDFKHLKYQ